MERSYHIENHKPHTNPCLYTTVQWELVHIVHLLFKAYHESIFFSFWIAEILSSAEFALSLRLNMQWCLKYGNCMLRTSVLRLSSSTDFVSKTKAFVGPTEHVRR